MRERTVIIVSPHFPPSAMVAGNRARHLARHLPSHGWQPLVVRVDENDAGGPQDEELARTLPPGLRQERVRALPRLPGIGDIGLRSYPFMRRTLERLVWREKPDAVFFTGFPFYSMLHAPALKRRYGVPIVLDFQDPWVSAYGASRPRWSKEGLAHRLALSLEPKALRSADFVTSVSDRQNADMAARYPWLNTTRMAALPIGGDPEDFANLRAHPRPSTVSLDPACINIVYVGAYWPRAEPVVRTLVRAMARLRSDWPDLAKRLRFHFIGTGETPLGPLIREEGVVGLVLESPQRLPFLDAMNVLANAQGQLLFGSDEPHYTSSKIYPALMSGRPYLSLYHAASSSHAVLKSAGGGQSFCFDSHQTLISLEQALAEGLYTLATNPQSLGAIDSRTYDAYSANAVTGKFAAIFESVKR